MSRFKKSTKEESTEPKSDLKVAPAPQNKDKKAAILKALKAVQETFGDRAAFFGNDSAPMDIEAVPTGSMGLDCAIGIGGFPKGRIIEISGQEGSGKTLVSLSAIAEVQKAGGIAVFIDAEHALTRDWCRKLGVNFDDLIISQPDSGEEALDIMDKFVKTNAADIVVLDSVAALVTKREIEGGMGDAHMAETARLMSLGLKKLSPVVSKSKVSCVFINQVRMNIGGYGNPEITPGGKALKFYASLRLKVSKVSGSEIKDANGNKIGHRLKVYVLKNKVAVPFREAEFDLYYEKGIDKKSEVSTLATAKGVVLRPNNRRYEYPDRQLVWTSRAEYEEALVNDKSLMEEIMQKTIQAIKENKPDVEVGAKIQEVNGSLVDITTGEILDKEANQEATPPEDAV